MGNYHESKKTDQYGNRFRFLSNINDNTNDRKLYDVSFVVGR
jgi:hypothetical protein